MEGRDPVGKEQLQLQVHGMGQLEVPSSPYLKYTWEFVEVFCKGDLKKKGLAENADIDADSFKEWVNAKWSIAPERKMKEYGHPAMFPEELARRVLLLFSFQGDMVWDPFAGVGTTCVVAKRTGRRYLGLDTSAEYCDTARTRLDSVAGLNGHRLILTWTPLQNTAGGCFRSRRAGHLQHWHGRIRVCVW